MSIFMTIHTLSKASVSVFHCEGVGGGAGSWSGVYYVPDTIMLWVEVVIGVLLLLETLLQVRPTQKMCNNKRCV